MRLHRCLFLYSALLKKFLKRQEKKHRTYCRPLSLLLNWEQIIFDKGLWFKYFTGASLWILLWQTFLISASYQKLKKLYCYQRYKSIDFCYTYSQWWVSSLVLSETTHLSFVQTSIHTNLPLHPPSPVTQTQHYGKAARSWASSFTLSLVISLLRYTITTGTFVTTHKYNLMMSKMHTTLPSRIWSAHFKISFCCQHNCK